MKKLGNGWQVNVYEYNSNTVYKKPHSGIRSYMSIIKNFPIIIFAPFVLRKWVNELKKSQLRSLKYISNKTHLRSHIGNPVIENSGSYYQEKAIPIYKYIKDIDEDEFKLLVDEFADFTHFLYQEGFIDKSFNFLKNFGVLDSKIILIDIGELFFESEKIKKQILNKAWSKSYVLKTIPRKHRNYFLNKMNTTFK